MLDMVVRSTIINDFLLNNTASRTTSHCHPHPQPSTRANGGHDSPHASLLGD